MEGQKTVNFTRLLSDESVQSTLSSDSCEYYQTEIFDLLPSVQAVRSQQDSYDMLKSSEAFRSGGPRPDEAFGAESQSRGPRDKLSLQPLRDLPICMQGKRSARERRKMQISNIGFWESWRRSQSINRKRVWAHMREAGASLLPWKHTLHKIQGRFGVGVKSYFVFLRYLIYLNLLHCALISGFILGPTGFYGKNSREWLRFGGDDSVLDFLVGTGLLARSPVFFGFYTRGSLDHDCLNTPLLYLAGILCIIFLSLIMVVRRTIVGYKHTWMLEKRTSMNVSFKVFCGWDYTIQHSKSAELKQSFIRNDLKLFLEERKFNLKKAQRTLGQKLRLYLLRFILNLIVVFLLGGAFTLIYYSTNVSLKESNQVWILRLILQYLSPITITSVDLVLPQIFRKISSFEDYSLTVQVNATLVRSIFLKLASLGIYLFFLFKTTSVENRMCRENQIGIQMYKLCIFNFLTTFCNTFLVNYPRKLLQEKRPTCLLVRLCGRQRFLIPFKVLDLVYIQTVFWVGVYYCPLLPMIGVVSLLVIFYIQKFGVLRCCEAEQRMFRASSSSVLFHFMLLLGLVMAAAAPIVDFHLAERTNTISCGPLKNETVLTVTETCVKSLPDSVQNVLKYLSSQAFALPLLLGEIIILTSYVSRGRANRKAIERLKDMLIMCSSDKRFLVKQHATLLRGPKNPNRVRPAAVEQKRPLHGAP
ncbi:transmembrane channel-like protein 7 [Poecilia latipinna]|uniref:Transmembrane channel-like protein n=1 Tax=Poecilia formosa TaxID=48698 RepID=A0A087X897_POEFO|nr:PREDICTED: transmembrane channel-like protein 8 [Poecilia formosa]XP_007570217.1 PREDICTED: transmembrane channel-like protein 8 [Poecilia formosa]XP_007570219.1 PREDICTED: transmembrane channel-like protein 8 [Poecilia formosa]XP_007570220.1 PREDICTED: transmembrane channel-like protein 8 [Poecilia formosa]XP_014894159.1 PREDICTED: transmembrane channel-like protein 8 [Poecilia latipinna]XP_014894160.1 PREDICTED: transmembrane channel-like protein 8 [Poecilia latipinna]XP_016536237.1 PRED